MDKPQKFKPGGAPWSNFDPKQAKKRERVAPLDEKGKPWPTDRMERANYMPPVTRFPLKATEPPPEDGARHEHEWDDPNDYPGKPRDDRFEDPVPDPFVDQE